MDLLANHLDKIGLVKEANYLDEIIKKATKDSKNNESNYELATKKMAEMIFELANEEYKEGVFTYEIHVQKEGGFPGKYYAFIVGDHNIFDKAARHWYKNLGADGIGTGLREIVRENLSVDEEAGRNMYKGGLTTRDTFEAPLLQKAYAK